MRMVRLLGIRFYALTCLLCLVCGSGFAQGFVPFYFRLDSTGNQIVPANSNWTIPGSYVTGDTAALPTNINATKIANGSVDNTEFQSLNSVRSLIQAQIDGKQSIVGTIRVVNPSFISGFDRANNRYPTVQEAIDSSVIGDLVKVTPETYDERVKLKNGVNLYLEAGATLINTIDGIALYDSGSVSCIIAGEGNIGNSSGFLSEGSGEITIFANSIFNVFANGTTKLHVVCNSIEEEFQVNNSNASVRATINKVTSLIDNSTGASVEFYNTKFLGLNLNNSAKPKFFNCNFDQVELSVKNTTAPEFYQCYVYSGTFENSSKPKFYNCNYPNNTSLTINNTTVEPSFYGYNHIFDLSSVNPTATVYVSGSLVLDNQTNINVVQLPISGYAQNKVLISNANGVIDTTGAISQSQVSGLTTSLGTKWGITGNSGTVDGTNFIGTTDNIAFNIRVNNQKAGRIDRSGGLNNNFFGYTAGNSINTGSKNNAFGTEALYSDTSGSQNIAFGYKALFTNSNANHNLAIGSEALLNSNADKNIAIGNLSLQANTSGTENFGLGYASIINNQTGDYNTAVGNFSLSGNQSGNSNTAIGHTALSGNTTGSENTAIGYQADVLGSNLTNATAIGANATVGVSNGFVLGNNSNLVGIGTSTPAYKLDVNGTGRFIDIIVDSIVSDNDLKIRVVNSTTIETTTGDILFKAPGSGFDFQGADYFQTQTYSTSFQNTGTFGVTASDVTITANNTSVSGGISIDTLTLNGRTFVYSTTTGIDAKTTGTTNLYTVPTGKNFSISEARIYVTSASAITVTPTLGIGIASGEDDIYFPTQLVGLDATNEMYRFSTGGTYRVGQAGDVVKLGIDTGATATTMTIKVVLIGDLE